MKPHLLPDTSHSNNVKPNPQPRTPKQSSNPIYPLQPVLNAGLSPDAKIASRSNDRKNSPEFIQLVPFNLLPRFSRTRLLFRLGWKFSYLLSCGFLKFGSADAVRLCGYSVLSVPFLLLELKILISLPRCFGLLSSRLTRFEEKRRRRIQFLGTRRWGERIHCFTLRCFWRDRART